MECPRCHAPVTRVMYTRSRLDPGIIYRRRRCGNELCRATFRTWERADPRDPCAGRRPDEPRRVLGRPTTVRSGPGAPPPAVAIPDGDAVVRSVDESPPGQANDHWTKMFSDEVTKRL